jgi:hypothetical protein
MVSNFDFFFEDVLILLCNILYRNCTFRIRTMVFNATFNNISAILWRSVLFVEEIRVPEKTNNLTQVTDKTLSHNGGVHFDVIMYILFIHMIFYISIKLHVLGEPFVITCIWIFQNFRNAKP